MQKDISNQKIRSLKREANYLNGFLNILNLDLKATNELWEQSMSCYTHLVAPRKKLIFNKTLNKHIEQKPHPLKYFYLAEINKYARAIDDLKNSISETEDKILLVKDAIIGEMHLIATFVSDNQIIKPINGSQLNLF